MVQIMDKINLLAKSIISFLMDFDESLADFFIELDEIDKKEFLTDLEDIIYDWTEKHY